MLRLKEHALYIAEGVRLKATSDRVAPLYGISSVGLLSRLTQINGIRIRT